VAGVEHTFFLFSQFSLSLGLSFLLGVAKVEKRFGDEDLVQGRGVLQDE